MTRREEVGKKPHENYEWSNNNNSNNECRLARENPYFLLQPLSPFRYHFILYFFRFSLPFQNSYFYVFRNSRSSNYDHACSSSFFRMKKKVEEVMSTMFSSGKKMFTHQKRIMVCGGDVPLVRIIGMEKYTRRIIFMSFFHSSEEDLYLYWKRTTILPENSHMHKNKTEWNLAFPGSNRISYFWLTFLPDLTSYGRNWKI